MGLTAQSYYPTAVSIPETGFEHLRSVNPYILSLTADGVNWIPERRFIREIAPNVDYTGTDIVSSWKGNTWEDNQTMLDSFELDTANRLSVVYNKSKYNYPGYTGESKAKYIFAYNASNQLTRLDYYEADPSTSNNYKKNTVTYFTYDVNGKRTADSNIYYYSGVQVYRSHYVYDGDKLTFLVRLNGTDTNTKTYYTYAGDLLTSTTSMTFDPGSDEWSINYTDTFEYDASHQVSRRTTAGYVFRDGNVSFENYRNETYTYTASNQLQEIIERLWQDSAWSNYTKTSITYQTNNKPEVGYQYLAEGSGWSASASTKYLFQVSTGIKAISNPLAGIVCYPNPANDQTTIDMGSHSGNLRLFDITGKCVYAQTGISGKHQIDLSTFNNGIYYATIQSGQFQYTSKIVVRH